MDPFDAITPPEAEMVALTEAEVVFMLDKVSVQAGHNGIPVNAGTTMQRTLAFKLWGLLQHFEHRRTVASAEAHTIKGAA